MPARQKNSQWNFRDGTALAIASALTIKSAIAPPTGYAANFPA
jgi:hypothetical protein